MHAGQSRIGYLDGLRCVAIMLVVLLHYWGACCNTLPPAFGTVVGHGWAGVELFFLISGFVIFLTVERCRNIADFLKRRWLRLFPAMLIATLLALIFSYTIQPIAAFRNSPLQDALPGLSFVIPTFWHAVLRMPVGLLDDSFWTLFVEMDFYILFSTLYFAFGWQRATVGLLLVGAVALAAEPSLTALSAPYALRRLVEPLRWLGLEYVWWFASGITFAKAAELADRRLFVLACLIGLAAALCVAPLPGHMDNGARLAMLSALVLFACAQRFRPLQVLLQAAPLRFIGLISYPLYLVHNRIGLGLIKLTEQAVPGLPSVLVPIPALILVICVAFLMTRYGEPALRRPLRRLMQEETGAGAG